MQHRSQIACPRRWLALIAVLAVLAAGCATSTSAPASSHHGTRPTAGGKSSCSLPSSGTSCPPMHQPVYPTCRVTKAQLIGNGGDQDWSRSNGLIAFDQTDTNGVYQLHTIKPDGTGDTCLTCAAQGDVPPLSSHKFNPVWAPNGEFIVVQVESSRNPLAWAARNKFVSELLLNGLWSDLYATTPTGDKWYKLTNSSTTHTDGVLAPSFSPDGTRLFWSRLVAPASSHRPWGGYRLMLADFVVQNGVPGLSNVRDITPPGGAFYEAHGFSPDGSKVIFTSDRGTANKWQMNIWTMNLRTQRLRELTQNGAWNEHAQYTPDGKKIVYMSTRPYPFSILKTELMMMNADGSGKVQLTHFNTRGYPDYSPQQGMPSRAIWNAGGTKLSVTEQMAKAYPARRLYILTFTGACG